MKKRLLIGATILLALLLTFVGYLAYQTLSHTGERALAVMSDAERSVAEKLKAVTSGMSPSELVALLGPPSRTGAGLRYTWRGPDGNPLSQYAVYFTPGSKTVRKIRWLKLGSFAWEYVPR